MSRSMKVVFREDVRGVALAGEMKTVRPGYARNFLIPRGLAFEANGAAVRQWNTERQGALAKAERKREAFRGLAEKIEAIALKVYVKASPEGRLFGSVGRQEILEALAAQGVTVEKRAILLAEPLKQVGAFEVAVHAGAGHDAKLKVQIVAEES